MVQLAIDNLHSEKVLASLLEINKLIDPYSNQNPQVNPEAMIQENTTDTPSQFPVQKSSNDRQVLEEFPVLCMTATNSPETEKDICSKLNIHADAIISSNTFLRKNLHLSFSKETGRAPNVMKIFQCKKWRNLRPLIIYCNFKVGTEICANYMKQNGYSAVSFSGDMDEFQKLNILQQFLKQSENEGKPKTEQSTLDSICNQEFTIDCICSTISLSVGLDHRHVRGLVHYNMSRNIENYLQEIGRSGRDGAPALCHSFITDFDYFFQRGKIFTEYVWDRESIKRVLCLVLNLDGRTVEMKKRLGGQHTMKGSKRGKNEETEESGGKNPNMKDVTYKFIRKSTF
jgi:superfamily II DNA helicase RecQ